MHYFYCCYIIPRGGFLWIVYPYFLLLLNRQVHRNDVGIIDHTHTYKSITHVHIIHWKYLYTSHKGYLSITVTSSWARWRLKSPVLRLFTQQFIQAQIKENIKPRVTGLCAGNSPVTGEFPAQRASNAENVSIWWRHHVNMYACRHNVRSSSDTNSSLIVLMAWYLSNHCWPIDNVELLFICFWWTYLLYICIFICICNISVQGSGKGNWKV